MARIQRTEEYLDPERGDRVVTRSTYDEPAESAAVEYQDDVVAGRTDTWYSDSLTGRVNAVLGSLLLALEALLILRFSLVAFGANRSSGFVHFVMDVSWPFVRPFTNAFSNRTWDQGIIEVSTLLAMGVWALVFLLIGMLLNAVLPHIGTTGAVTHRRRVTHV